ncbi:MAG TPA: hypothetical protein VK858_00905 [Longimicrobiales bacterium]|nr:hypothetical protein [Longimicrobiales bacterium]
MRTSTIPPAVVAGLKHLERKLSREDPTLGDAFRILAAPPVDLDDLDDAFAVLE